MFTLIDNKCALPVQIHFLGCSRFLCEPDNMDSSQYQVVDDGDYVDPIAAAAALEVFNAHDLIRNLSTSINILGFNLTDTMFSVFSNLSSSQHE